MNMNIDSVLITRKNLDDYLTEPLHENFWLLSDVHKADYLRCYLMHFYGGAYADIKPPTEDWSEYMKEMSESENIWLMGYPQPHYLNLTGFTVEDLEEKKIMNFSDTGFLCKRDTPLTNEWYNSLIKKMDDNSEQLKKYPAEYSKHNYCKNFSGPQYPFDYKDILDEILQPITCKYEYKVSRILPPLDCRNYL